MTTLVGKVSSLVSLDVSVTVRSVGVGDSSVTKPPFTMTPCPSVTAAMNGSDSTPPPQLP